MSRSRLNPGRVAAIKALLAAERGQNADEALGKLAPADPADRALAWNVALGVLRNRAALDAGITVAARRAVWTLDPPVLAILRAAAFEMAFTRTPPHAAVDQAVELSRAAGVGHAAGLVNAVLRKVEVPREGDAALGFPEWLVARWRAARGADADVYMRACADPAEVHLVARAPGADLAAEFAAAGRELHPVGAGVYRLPQRAGRIEDLPGYAEGRWWVMDPAAVAVADLVPQVERVLDTCAAPGGKSLRLASRGMRVTATDADAERLERVRQNAARVGLPLETACVDWEQAGLGRTFPAVLVDAPCTALGLVRRHPEIRWRRTEADIRKSAARQVRILARAAASVAPGGVLVYAVCSPEPEEGPAVAATLGWPIEATFDNAANSTGADVFYACRMVNVAGRPAVGPGIG